MFSIRRLTASVLAVALAAALVPFSAPAFAAEVGIAAVGGADLKALSVIDANTIVAVGATGEIHKSANGGSTWTKVRNADAYSFVGVDFWSATAGVAVDATGKVASSTNGGDTWTNVYFGPTYDDMDQGADLVHGKVACLPGSTTHAVAAAGDANQFDDTWFGGMTFRTRGVLSFWGYPDATSAFPSEQRPHWYPGDSIVDPGWYGEGALLDVDFATSSIGVVCGEDYYSTTADPTRYPLFTTADSGLTWTGRSLGTTNVRLNGVALGSTTVGVTVGTLVADGTARAFRTADGGVTWTAGTLPAGYTASLNGVDMSSATQGWAVAANGTILRTTDGGANWSYCTVPASTPALYDVEFLDNTTQGWAVGASGAALRTTDGINWEALPSAGGDVTPPVMGAVTSSTHPDAGSWYSHNDPALAWSASDASGIAGYSYILDQSASTTPDTTLEPAGTSTSYTDKADGLWYFHIRAQDDSANHNWSTVTHRAVRIDTTPPSTTSNAAASYTSAATITLTPSDTYSGVATTYWSVDGGSAGTGTSVVVSAEGSWTLRWHSVDAAGNVEGEKTASFTIEIPPGTPVISSSSHPDENAWYATRDVAAGWTASDPSGIGGYAVTLDQSAATVPAATVTQAGATFEQTLAADGVYYLHVRAVDTRGNWSAADHFRLRADTAAPSGTVSVNGGAASTSTRNVTLTIAAGDGAGSGVTQMRVSNDGVFDSEPWETYTGSKSWTLAAGDGVKTVYVQFHDAVNLLSGTASDSIELVTPTTVTYVPLEGADRYGTAVSVSKSAFPAGADAVIVATGLNFPDALASAGLAGVVEAPILLVHGSERTLARDGLAMAEADRVLAGASPKRVYVIGGPLAVSTGIESALKARYGAANVVRLGGTDRYGTAYTVAVRMKSEMASRAIPWSGDAFVVPGLDFRDALIVGPESYAANRPIMLYDPRGTGGLSSYCSALGVTKAAVSGAGSGTGAVPTSLTLPGVALSRIASAGTPAARSVQVAGWAASPAAAIPGFGWGSVGVATSDLYPDGLAAAPKMGSGLGPLLLTPSRSLDATVRSALVANDAAISEVRYFGGPVAVTPAVRSAVDAALH